jgi:DNA ligase 1
MSEMNYSEFVEVYEELVETTKRLEKETILAKFLRKLKEKGKSEWIHLLKGNVVADYDPREIGISGQLTIKAISKSLGVKESDVVARLRKIGDLGEIAEEFTRKKRQSTLFSKRLKVEKVFDNIQKMMEVEGKDSVDRKMALVSELLGQASEKEAKYIVRTLMGDLRIGVADGIIKDGIAEAFFDIGEKKEMSEVVEKVYGLSNDFAVVFDAAAKGKKELDKVGIVPGRAVNVMLAVKAKDIRDAFRICGKPAAIEHKYDGFRVVISNDGKEIKLFTRRLEEVTKQFPDVVKVVEKHVKGKSYILDSEVVGFDPKTKKYKPFEAISQRIRRKYDIEKLERDLPVEVNVFDVLYLNGKGMMGEPFKERRKLVEKIVKTEKLMIRPAVQIITDSEDVAEKFYKEAMKIGEEGIMVKSLDKPYHTGRKVGYLVKMKPDVADLDLVVVGAEYGTGKRGGWLTSYIVACKSGDKFLEVGKVSSGLKELEQEEGTTYAEMTKILKPLITKTKDNVVRVKPKVVVSLTYQNLQGSPNYNSGYALRFPRITHYRPDKKVGEIATLEDIKKEVKKGR